VSGKNPYQGEHAESSPGAEDPATTPHPHVATSQAASESEAEAANAAFERSHPGAQGDKP
jgi:hypothetical protein